MAEPTIEHVAVSRLRVGMFVHVDVEGLPSSLPVGRFLIRNEAQLAQLRALGRAFVAYDPRRSAVGPLPEPSLAREAPQSWASLGVPWAETDADAREPAGEGGAVGLEPVKTEAVGAVPVHAPPADAQALRRARLREQQARLDRCERGFAEASRAVREVLRHAVDAPLLARKTAEAQVDGMVGEVEALDEVAIRLLSEKAGQESTLHPLNVSLLSVLLGRALGFDRVLLQRLGLGALLHDLGKLSLPERLRWRDDHPPGPDRRIFQSHAAGGVTLARAMGLPAEAQAIIAQHHEHADGSGYPSGLRSEAIHPLARVVALVNQYDSLCNPGNPSRALTPHDALAWIFARQREAFDAKVLAAFIRMMGVYPPGSMLQLNDERFAIVVAVNSDRPLRPRVLVHEAGVPADEALEIDLEAEPSLGIQRAVRPLHLPRAVYDSLSPRKRMCYFFERSMPSTREALA